MIETITLGVGPDVFLPQAGWAWHSEPNHARMNGVNGQVFSSLLSSKLQVPRVRGLLVSRPRLLSRMDAASQLPLALLAAPAGFGKTTLVCDWVAQNDRRVAWVSLDPADNDPARFWAYTLAALENLQAGLSTGEQALPDATAPGDGPQAPHALLTALINALAGLPWDFSLVFDDYHAIRNPQIHDALAYIVNYAPACLHIVLATRAEPPLPLSRWRARGTLGEIRAADLRFTPDEARQFLTGVMSLGLPEEDSAALETYTEGWIAGLQLAALALRQQEAARIHDLISGSVASRRYILDYLSAEVLQAQEPGVQNFLRQTAILDQFSAPLCDAVTGRTDSQAVLSYLDRAELFVVPLDPEGRWYRYHNSFAPILLKLLGETEPALIPELHRRAAHWYQAQPMYPEAIRHAFAVPDHDLAADLIEVAGIELLARAEVVTVLSWLAALPPEQVRSRTDLCIYYLVANLVAWRVDDLQRFVAELQEGPPPPPATAERGHELHSVMMAVQALLAAKSGDESRMSDLARYALESAPDEATWPGVLRPWVRGLSYLLSGEPESASQTLAEMISASQSQGNLLLVAATVTAAARLDIEYGRLSRAGAVCRRAIVLLRQRGASRAPVAGLVYSMMALTLRLQDDLEGAEEHVLQALPLIRHWGATWALLRNYVSLAWIRQGRGDLAGAEEALRSASGLAEDEALVNAHEAALALARGDVDVAARWAGELSSLWNPPKLDLLSFVPAKTATWPWLLVAQGQAAQAVPILQRLLDEPAAKGRVPFQIHCLGLLALAWRSQGQPDRAWAALGEALGLAEPEGYVRVLLDLGRPLIELLRQGIAGHAWPEPSTSAFAGKLVALAQRAGAAAVAGGQPAGVGVLVEPLSAREMEALRLAAQGLSNQEIAELLYLGLGTVKTHMHNIYGKLGVESRKEAVARARDLKLL
jgi:LuxR family maltose regulon positive regulatory protein